MHDDLIRAGRRRLVLAAFGGLGLLAVSVALVLFPLVWVAVLVVAAVRDGTTGWPTVGRAALASLVVGAVSGAALFALAWLGAERRVTEALGVRPHRVPEGRAAQLRNVSEGLALAAGVPPPQVAVIADPAPNALTVGRRPATSWIVVTSGLVDLLSRDELEAVLAYEIGRIAVRSVSLDTVVYASTAVAFEVWVGAFGGLDELSVVLVPVAVLATPLVAGGVVLRRAALRSRAHLSDGLAVSYCRNPVALLTALRRLDGDGRQVRVGGSGAAHLWLVYPHTRASRWLLGSHRLLADRIARLERALPPGT